MMNEMQNRCAAAADFCALRDAKETLPGEILVLDLDGLTAALCRCTPKGGITQAEQVAVNQTADLISALASALQLDREACETLCRTQADAAEKRFRRYLRAGGMLDMPLLETPEGVSVSCAEAERLFAPMRGQLDTLLSMARDMLARQNADETALRVLLVGLHACLFPVEAAVRAGLFGGDALMADLRFADRRPGLDPSELVGRGEALYRADAVEESKPFGHSVVLELQTVVNGQLSPSSITLAEADTPLETIQEGGELSPPFYLGEAEMLRFTVDGAERLLPMPTGLANIVRVRLKQMADGQLYLRVLLPDGKALPIPFHIQTA